MSLMPPHGHELLQNDHFFSTLKITANPIPNMKVSISAGCYWLPGNLVTYRGGQSPTFESPTVNSRWSLLVLDKNGLPKIINGDTGSSPSYPVCPPKTFPLSLILLSYGDTAITSNKIFDVRAVYAIPTQSHNELIDSLQDDLHNINSITGLDDELSDRPTMDDLMGLLEGKADTDGTASDTFYLNKEGGSVSDVLSVRVNTPSGERWLGYNPISKMWEYTNDGNNIINLTDLGPVVAIPTASTNVLGAIKVGSLLSIDTHGVLAADSQTEEDFTTEEKTKLAGIEDYANMYEHPSNPAHTMDELDETNDLVIMTATERSRLAGMEDNANNYSHPTGPCHLASEVDEVYDRYFLTREEKDKLFTVQEHANYYEHPTNPVHTAGDIQEESNRRFMTDAERQKLAGVQASANYYVHSATHSANMIDDSGTPLKRFVRDDQITLWDAKATIYDVTSRIDAILDDAPTDLDTLNKLAEAVGNDPNFADMVALELNQKLDIHPTKVLTDVNFTFAYENKLQGIEHGANFYVHPSNPSHTTSDIQEDTNRYFVTEVEKQKLTEVPGDISSQLALITTKEDAYTVGNSVHWGGTDPADASEALDRLAAAVYTLLGGVIP